MSEGLWEVAKQAARARIVILRDQSDIVTKRGQAFEKLVRFPVVSPLAAVNQGLLVETCVKRLQVDHFSLTRSRTDPIDMIVAPSPVEVFVTRTARIWTERGLATVRNDLPSDSAPPI